MDPDGTETLYSLRPRLYDIWTVWFHDCVVDVLSKGFKIGPGRDQESFAASPTGFGVYTKICSEGQTPTRVPSESWTRIDTDNFITSLSLSTAAPDSIEPGVNQEFPTQMKVAKTTPRVVSIQSTFVHLFPSTPLVIRLNPIEL